MYSGCIEKVINCMVRSDDGKRNGLHVEKMRQSFIMLWT